MPFCTACGAKNPDDARFCNACGAAMPTAAPVVPAVPVARIKPFDNPDELAKISPDKLAVTVGILTDKAAQLTGMASSIVEHRKGASLDDAAKMIFDAKARIASKIKEDAIEAEIL